MDWSGFLHQTSSTTLGETAVERALLTWLEAIGWRVVHGPDIAPDAANEERDDYEQVILDARLRSVVAELNPGLSGDALEDALRRLTRPPGPTREARNRALHRLLVDGVTVEYVDTNGAVRGAQVRVIDFDLPEANDWLAVNQFTVVENKHERRPDIVLFVNGLPLGVIELKNPTDENATIRSAFQQLQTYKAEIPSLFAFNAALIVSDGLEARIGTLTSPWEWFKPWRTITGETLADSKLPQLQVLVEGVCARRRLLALHRVRGRRERRARQEDGGLPPVPRGGDCGHRNVARGSVATAKPQGERSAGPLRVRSATGRCAG